MPDGYEVSIRTPVTPPRWEDFNEVRAAACTAACLPAPAHVCMQPGFQYGVTQSPVWVLPLSSSTSQPTACAPWSHGSALQVQELTACWGALMEALAAGDRPQTADRALHFAYYWCALPEAGRRHHQWQHQKFHSQLTRWRHSLCCLACAASPGHFPCTASAASCPPVLCRYNFMPLARGSAVVGAMTVLAVFMAAGMPITASIPSVWLIYSRFRLQNGSCTGSVGKPTSLFMLLLHLRA